MDVLSRLIELARLQPTLDIRCRLQGAFHIDHEPVAAGTLPFHLILGGDCLIRLGSGREITLRSGDFLLLPRGDAHSIVGLRPRGEAPPLRIAAGGMLPLRENGEGEADVDLLCGHFDCAPGSAALLLDSLPDVFHVSLAEESEELLKTLVAMLYRETVEERPGALAIITATCLSLFIMAVRAGKVSTVASSGLLQLLGDARLGKSVVAMMSSPAFGWTIDDLARHSAMSRATYARQFRERAGMTVGVFLADIRMMLASDLLLRTRRAVADIAAEVGYESEAAFGKAFKARRGITPARFRAAEQARQNGQG
ncbi:AraC family transcriptional regulator [Rhizobium sp. CF142]|uniref:AraC family transcriptional regulator n=1 Tax=Rhizobium sp. CF142 TaxID=1144314 RepID=UPI00026EFF41|nr:AraC family transcriptional regulator [Rhizobium sp. CF142]EJJ27513.1 DNA-binding domain-containing protein, AraC-type [Rhizobium sp. CF142]